MNDVELSVLTPDGAAIARLIRPDDGRKARWPLVVFFADAGGIRPAMIEMAGHLTGDGYAVLMPDPYWRQAPYAPFDARTVFSDPPERARLMKMVETMKATEWIADTVALVAAIDDARIATARLGLVGYCMGGRTAFLAAAELGGRVAAASCIHAGGLVGDTDASPHRKAAAIAAALYLAVADEDRSCTPKHQAELRKALDAAGVRYEIEVYEGARHGFAVPDFPVYDETAAAKSWARTLGLFGEQLR